MLISANTNRGNQDEKDRQKCAGMYSRKGWGGSVDPFILVKFLNKDNNTDPKPVVSMVIFEWKDVDLIGVLPTPEALQVSCGDGGKIIAPQLIWIQKQWQCDEENVRNDFCNSTEIGEFIVAKNATEISKSIILTQAVDLTNPQPIHYAIKTTGFYCIDTISFSNDDLEYTAIVEFRNAYGELPGAQIAKLPFYGGLTIGYAVVAAYVRENAFLLITC